MKDQKSVDLMLLRLEDLSIATRLSSRTITRLRASGRLPKPDFCYGRLPRWYPRTIERWLAGGGLSGDTATPASN
jgi:predicted DNA-binding transcriptional regulator AlpA